MYVVKRFCQEWECEANVEEGGYNISDLYVNMNCEFGNMVLVTCSAILEIMTNQYSMVEEPKFGFEHFLCGAI